MGTWVGKGANKDNVNRKRIISLKATFAQHVSKHHVPGKPLTLTLEYNSKTYAGPNTKKFAETTSVAKPTKIPGTYN